SGSKPAAVAQNTNSNRSPAATVAVRPMDPETLAPPLTSPARSGCSDVIEAVMTVNTLLDIAARYNCAKMKTIEFDRSAVGKTLKAVVREVMTPSRGTLNANRLPTSDTSVLAPENGMGVPAPDATAIATFG